MNRCLKRNDELWEAGGQEARWTILDPVPRGGHVKVHDLYNHRDEYLSQEDLLSTLVEGRLILRNRATPRVAPAVQHNPKLDAAIREARAHMREVEQLQSAYGVTMARAYNMAREQHQNDTAKTKAFPSRATLYRYAKALRNGAPILKGDANKGNDRARYDEKVVDVIRDTAEKLFLVPGSKWTWNSLAKDVNAELHEQGLLPPDKSVSRDFVTKTVRETLAADVDIHRMDPKLVPGAKAIASHRIVAVAPFQRVEQDALHLPFVVRTAHGTTSNVWVVHAIDCCTGMVAGWSFVVGSPRETDGFRCVEMMFFAEQKQAAFQRLGLTSDYNVSGTPHTLVFDNGPEASRGRMLRLAGVGVDPIHLKSHHPQGKPYIERLNRSLKAALERLPGCTRYNRVDGKRDPIKLGDRLMTVEELERWVVDWYYAKWSHTVLDRHLHADFHERVRLGETPARRWTGMTIEHAYPLPLPPTLVEWRSILYDRFERALSRKTGITVHGHNYRGDNLAYLIDRYGERNVSVLVNPDDYRQVFVDEGEGQPLVPLTEQFVTETTPAYSFEDVKKSLEQSRASVPEAPDAARFDRDLRQFTRESQLRAGAKRRRRSEANQEVAERARHTQAVERARTNPLAKMKESSRTAGQDWSFDEAESLPVLNRVSGKEHM